MAKKKKMDDPLVDLLEAAKSETLIKLIAELADAAEIVTVISAQISLK